ncbi:MAG: CheR family methyltransferase [Xanthobacteraceae bacterium]|nr:CheR family methyltransferase [Xanthobacteraceae bacterium]
MSEAAAQLSDRHFRSVAELIEQEVGIRLPAGKRFMLEGRLHKRARALDCTGLNEYVERLFDHAQFETELVHLIDCVTTNKTDFFREPTHFTFMRDVAVPSLLDARRRRSNGLKVWSAASSTGMEAYTAAIVLDDMIRSGGRFQFRILGTDISTGVLRLARAGIYTREMIAPVPPDLVRRYFLAAKDPSRDEVRVVPELRRLTHFMRMNLMDATYPVDCDVDIIFCRNVLIYFDKQNQRKVVDRLCHHLRPGGYLMVGHSESMVHAGVPHLRQVQPTIFQV